MTYAVDMTSCGMIYTRCFLKIGAGIQVILIFWLNNLKCYNVGIADGGICELRHLNWFRWHDIRTKFHVDWYRHAGNIEDLPQQL